MEDIFEEARLLKKLKRDKITENELNRTLEELEETKNKSQPTIDNYTKRHKVKKRKMN